MAPSFAATLLAGPSGRRVIPLELARGYRDAGGQPSSVTLTRAARCASCLGLGCDACEQVGWTLEDVTAVVTLSPGMTVGACIPVDGAGDSLDGQARAITVEICEPGDRAADLRAADHDLVEKLRLAWSMDRARHGRRRRRRRCLLAIAAVALALVPLGHHLSKGKVGDACSEGVDCRSSHCIQLITFTQDEEERVDGRMCTAACTTDLDCPASMTCTVPTAPKLLVGEVRTEEGWRRTTSNHGPRAWVRSAPTGRSCVPRGY